MAVTRFKMVVNGASDLKPEKGYAFNKFKLVSGCNRRTFTTLHVHFIYVQCTVAAHDSLAQ